MRCEHAIAQLQIISALYPVAQNMQYSSRLQIILYLCVEMPEDKVVHTLALRKRLLILLCKSCN